MTDRLSFGSGKEVLPYLLESELALSYDLRLTEASNMGHVTPNHEVLLEKVIILDCLYVCVCLYVCMSVCMSVRVCILYKCLMSQEAPECTSHNQLVIPVRLKYRLPMVVLSSNRELLVC